MPPLHPHGINKWVFWGCVHLVRSSFMFSSTNTKLDSVDSVFTFLTCLSFLGCLSTAPILYYATLGTHYWRQVQLPLWLLPDFVTSALGSFVVAHSEYSWRTTARSFHFALVKSESARKASLHETNKSIVEMYILLYCMIHDGYKKKKKKLSATPTVWQPSIISTFQFPFFISGLTFRRCWNSVLRFLNYFTVNYSHIILPCGAEIMNEGL